MNVKETKFKIKKLVDAFRAGSLLRNDEYQRGQQWTQLQMARFIDSVFRKYPVPALFFHEREGAGLEDRPAKEHEIIDGQQRLIALRNFSQGQLKLLEVTEGSKLRLPKSVRDINAPWAGKLHGDLTPELRELFEEFEMTVFIVRSDASQDEVRDLFIRLQSGTALTRQQVRDAWPGNIGPFVEFLAGKLKRRPSEKLLSLIDRRGQRLDEDEVDQFMSVAHNYCRCF